MAGALDSPDTRTDRVPIREAKRCRVTASPRRHHRLRHHRPRARGNDRQCVPIAVRVDTGSHSPARLQASRPILRSTRSVRDTGLMQGNRAAGL